MIKTLQKVGIEETFLKIINIRVEINEIKNRKIESQQDQKLFFWKNNKIDKLLAILTKRKETTQRSKIKNKSGEGEKPYDHLNRCRESFRQNSTPIYDKNPAESRHRGELSST